MKTITLTHRQNIDVSADQSDAAQTIISAVTKQLESVKNLAEAHDNAPIVLWDQAEISIEPGYIDQSQYASPTTLSASVLRSNVSVKAVIV